MNTKNALSPLRAFLVYVIKVVYSLLNELTGFTLLALNAGIKAETIPMTSDTAMTIRACWKVKLQIFSI